LGKERYVEKSESDLAEVKNQLPITRGDQLKGEGEKGPKEEKT